MLFTCCDEREEADDKALAVGSAVGLVLWPSLPQLIVSCVVWLCIEPHECWSSDEDHVADWYSAMAIKHEAYGVGQYGMLYFAAGKASINSWWHVLFQVEACDRLSFSVFVCGPC